MSESGSSSWYRAACPKEVLDLLRTGTEGIRDFWLGVLGIRSDEDEAEDAGR